MLAIRETPAAYSGGPRLLDRVRHAIRTRHYSGRTEKAYVGAAEISRFLTALAVDGKVAASTQNQAMNALVFLYRAVLEHDLPWLDDVVRARRPRHLPVVFTRDEIHRVLAHLDGVPRLVALLLYGCGLRLLECLQLRVQDLDFSANQITIRSGKGGRDRVTMLPAAAKPGLLEHIAVVRRQHASDVEHGTGSVWLPGALARKYPRAAREIVWQWAFPATRHYVDPVTGLRRRHHLHETAVQRAVRGALRAAGITKHASCHTFRHSFATHF